MYDVSLDRITVRLPKFAQHIRNVLGVNDKANFLVSPYVSIDVRDGGSEGYAFILYCYDKTQQAEMTALVHTGTITHMNVTLVTEDEHTHLACRIARPETEAILMDDNFFIGENPSAYPMSIGRNEFKFPSTRGIPSYGWSRYPDSQDDDWAHDTFMTVCAIHAEAWEDMGMSEDEVEAALGIMTEDDLYPADYTQD